ncbi:MAG: insulinase family protein, partial [Oscillospiraceae bacterium]|nr:insulinase family protein [Oscillospiraceae bacterium]
KEIKYSEPVKIEKQLENEPENIVNSLIEINLPVSQSQFCIGYKLKPLSVVDMLRALVQCEVICEMLVGEGSDLYKYFYDTGVVAGGNIGYEVFCGDGYFALLFQGESSDPKKVLEKINGEIEKRRINGFTEKDFELVKNAEYGRCIRSFSSPDDIASLMLNSFILKCDVYDKLEIIANLKFDDIKYRLNSIKTDNVTLSIVNPLKS